MLFIHVIYISGFGSRFLLTYIFVCPPPSQIQKEVEVELDRLVGQEGSIHTKMLALQRIGYSWF